MQYHKRLTAPVLVELLKDLAPLLDVLEQAYKFVVGDLAGPVCVEDGKKHLDGGRLEGRVVCVDQSSLQLVGIDASRSIVVDSDEPAPKLRIGSRRWASGLVVGLRSVAISTTVSSASTVALLTALLLAWWSAIATPTLLRGRGAVAALVRGWWWWSAVASLLLSISSSSASVPSRGIGALLRCNAIDIVRLS